jgi:LacI family transcriptional regulator
VFTKGTKLDHRIRIKDIAKLAGVSPGTVDRVIHQRGNVSTKSKSLILDVMEKMGYQPNIIASTLALNRNFQIAILMPNPEQDVYWKQPLVGAKKALKQVNHYGIRFSIHFFDLFCPKDFLEKASFLMEQTPSPDAILVAPIFYEEGIEFLKKCNDNSVPLITINTNTESPFALSYVGQDSYQSGVLAARLLKFGLRNDSTVLITNLDNSTEYSRHLNEKENGFRDYFRRKSEFNTKVIKLHIEDFENKQLIRNEFLKILNDAPDLSGIFVTNSRAYHLVNACHDVLPSANRIVGYDLIEPNLKWLEREKINFLINQNPVQQGYLGIMNLVQFILHKKIPDQYQFLPLDIVVQENVKYYLRQEKEFEIII